MNGGNHLAIPTRYAGVRFRSRLEARWAAFFDAVGWTWDYEPDDMHGWTPDFLVDVPGHGPTFVEVKPARDLEQLAKMAQKAATGHRSGVMAFGLGPFGDGRTLGLRFDGVNWSKVRTKRELRDFWRDAYNPTAWNNPNYPPQTAHQPGFAAKVPWFARARAGRLARGDDEATAGAWAALVDLMGATDDPYCDWMAGLLCTAEEVDINESSLRATARYREKSVARSLLTNTMQQRMMRVADELSYQLVIVVLPNEAFESRRLPA